MSIAVIGGATSRATTHPGLYAIGLRWLHSLPSSLLAGVGADAAHIVKHITTR